MFLSLFSFNILTCDFTSYWQSFIHFFFKLENDLSEIETLKNFIANFYLETFFIFLLLLLLLVVVVVVAVVVVVMLFGLSGVQFGL